MIRQLRNTLRGQRGFTLIEAMIVVAIMGIIGSVVSRLLFGGMRGWVFNYGHMTSQRQLRVARDIFIKFTRQAKASTVVLDRYNSSQPVLSMVTYVDAAGNSRAFFQQDNKFYSGAWSLSGGARVISAKKELLVVNYLQRANFYYPDLKDYTKLGFCLYSVWYIPKNMGTSIGTALNGTVDIRNP